MYQPLRNNCSNTCTKKLWWIWEIDVWDDWYLDFIDKRNYFFRERFIFFLISQNLPCNFFTLKTISDYSVELNHSIHEHDKLKFPVPGELTIIKRELVFNMANLKWELWCYIWHTIKMRAIKCVYCCNWHLSSIMLYLFLNSLQNFLQHKVVLHDHQIMKSITINTKINDISKFAVNWVDG